MENMIRFVILLIPGLGLAALYTAIGDSMDPASREEYFRLGIRVFVIVFALSVLLFGWRKVSQALRSSIPSRYTAPKVTGARVGDGIGELEVAARHSSEVSKLILPRGSKIISIRPNELYRVEFQTNKESIVKAIARENGYRGKVG